MAEQNTEIIMAESDSGPRRSYRIGDMTYLVGIHFKPDASETFGQKINRMMRSECGFSPQTV